MNLVIELSSQDMYILEAYAQQEKASVQDVSSVLNNMILEVTTRETNVALASKFEKFTGIDPLTLVQV